MLVAIELLRGIVYDVYMIARGYNPTVFVTWIVIHTLIIATGILVLRSARPADGTAAAAARAR